MAHPIDETVETLVSLEGDVPDEQAFGRGLGAAPPALEEELVGTVDDVENGALVGWSD